MIADPDFLSTLRVHCIASDTRAPVRNRATRMPRDAARSAVDDQLRKKAIRCYSPGSDWEVRPNKASKHMMAIRKTVTLVEEISSEYGAPASPPLRRVAIAAVFENQLAGKPAGADLTPLIDYSLELGSSLTKAALATLG